MFHHEEHEEKVQLMKQLFFIIRELSPPRRATVRGCPSWFIIIVIFFTCLPESGSYRSAG